MHCQRPVKPDNLTRENHCLSMDPHDDTPQHVAQRVFRFRLLGAALGLLAVLAVFHERGVAAPAWVLVVAYAALWPGIARQLALQHPHPLPMIRRTLYVDSAMGGIWIALMQFNLFPSLVIAAMLTMDKFAFGGPRLALQGAVLMVSTTLLAGWANGFAHAVDSSPLVVLATCPLLLAYTSAIAQRVHVLGQRTRHQSDALRVLARFDPLTGLANRQSLEDALQYEFHRFRRGGHPAVFMLVDLDHYNPLHSAFGQAVADAALVSIAAVLRTVLREGDTIARVGKDRFGIVLPDIGSGPAAELTDRVRAAVAQTDLAPPRDLRTSASVGWAEIDREMLGIAGWMAAADAALYAAKATGRPRMPEPPWSRATTGANGPG